MMGGKKIRKQNKIRVCISLQIQIFKKVGYQNECTIFMIQTLI